MKKLPDKSKPNRTPVSQPPPSSEGDNNTLASPAVPGKTHEQLVARVATNPVSGSAATARRFGKGLWGDIGVTECSEAISELVQQVRRGDMSCIEARLAAQAIALDAIFHELARRASMNMGEYLETATTYLRLALKAQAQSRDTMETLAEVKYPRQVAFVRQANVAHGPQQVNNGQSPELRDQYARARTHAGNSQNPPTELLEATRSDEWLDCRAAGATSGSDTPMEALGAVNRSKDAGRES